MKLLIVPSMRVSDHSRPKGWKWLTAAKSVARGRYTQARRLFAMEHCDEVNFFGEMPDLNGVEDTYILGNYTPGYTKRGVPEDSHYPSHHGLPKGRHVSVKEARCLISSSRGIGRPTVDVVLIEALSGPVGEYIREEARENGRLVCILDFFDDGKHLADPTNVSPFRQWSRGRDDFDLYFKLCCPVGGYPGVIPLSLLPVRAQNYPSTGGLHYNDRDISVFFRGAIKDKKRSDRATMASEIRKRVQFSVIEDRFGPEPCPLSRYWELMGRSRIGLSPGGTTIVWDCIRHAELGLFGCVPLMPTRLQELAQGEIVDGKNCLVYETDKDGTIRDLEGTIERVRDVSRNRVEWERLSLAWRNEVLTNHTTIVRQKYMLAEMGKRL